MLWIIDVSYTNVTSHKRTYDQIYQIEHKLELFIANWSYSYNLKIVFATYQRMRANRTSWAGTCHLLCTPHTLCLCGIYHHFVQYLDTWFILNFATLTINLLWNAHILLCWASTTTAILSISVINIQLLSIFICFVGLQLM